jgi:deferrochelatase/peroxidase EfeB
MREVRKGASYTENKEKTGNSKSFLTAIMLNVNELNSKEKM